MIRTIDAGALTVAYQETGDPGGWPAVLLHGFPYDIHAYDAVAPILASAGARVIVPWLRGFGETQFRSGETIRSGEQAALGHDLLDLLDALHIPSAILAGYDWGGRAACVVAALWPERARGLVSQNSYNIQDIAHAGEPQAPEDEHRLWYQYYFQSERGRRGLEQNRHGLCRLLWRLWSPEWHFDDAVYERTAVSFDNADFVEVVIHSYRHRYGLVPGDPSLAEVERRLSAKPPITIPSIIVDGDADGVRPPGGSAGDAHHFEGPHEHRIFPKGGHNLPQEMPQPFAAAVLDLHRR